MTMKNDYLAEEIRRAYRVQTEIAASRNTNNILEWLYREYLTESEADDLMKYSNELKEEILNLTGR